MTMIMILLLLFLATICSITFGTTTCHDAYSCEENTINEVSSGNVQCYGYHSCFEATITVTGNSDIICSGSYSCYKAVDLSIDTTSGDYNIHCRGLFSCALVDTIYNYGGNVGCYEEWSCFQSNIELGTSGAVDDHIYIFGDHGAAQASLTGGYYNQARGSYCWQNATIYGTLDNARFLLYSHNAGYGAIIICGDGLTCNIYCSGNGFMYI